MMIVRAIKGRLRQHGIATTVGSWGGIIPATTAQLITLGRMAFAPDSTANGTNLYIRTHNVTPADYTQGRYVIYNQTGAGVIVSVEWENVSA